MAEETKVTQFTEFVNHDDVDEGSWSMRHDNIDVPFTVEEYEDSADGEIAIALGRHDEDGSDETYKSITIGNKCAIVTFGKGHSELADLMYEHTNRGDPPEECPGYRPKGYSRWLLGLVDHFNERFESHFCELFDVMHFLPGQGSGLSHFISPFLIALRGYSVYEDMGYLPMKPTHTLEELATELDKVNTTMLRRHRILTSAESFATLKSQVIAVLQGTHGSMAKVELLVKKQDRVRKNNSTKLKNAMNEIMRHHSPFATVFLLNRRFSSKDSMKHRAYDNTEYIWSHTQRDVPAFESEAKGMTISEVMASKDTKYPISSYRLANKADIRLTEAVKTTGVRMLYITADNKLRDLCRVAVLAKRDLVESEAKNKKTKETLSKAKTAMSVIRVVEDDRFRNTRALIKEFAENYDKEVVGYQMNMKRIYTKVHDMLDIDEALFKMYSSPKENAKVAIVRKTDKETGAPMFKLTFKAQ